MARGDRPARPRADRRARARAACSLSRRGRRLQRRRAADRIPGSPALARAFLRAQDRLVACELEPNAAAALARNLAGDRRSKAVAIDGWTALNAYVPPKERRGLVLVDPAFEDAGDFARLAQTLAAAHRKWASGIYLAWYPIKERAAADALARRLRQSGMAKILRAELGVAAPRAATRLSACGLIVINPPWTLAASLRCCCRSLRAPCRRRAWAATASIGSPAKSSFATFPQPRISLFS
jgi:23S rRNA (adenine2030-N6)-methyltransferase